MAKIIRHLGILEERSLATIPSLPSNASVGRRWRFRRNLVIYVAAGAGVSYQHLSQVFDIPRSRVSSILEDFRRYETTWNTEHPRIREQRSHVLTPQPPSKPSRGQRWRFRRNVVIYVAARGGLPHQYLSDVFDLARSRISTIVKKFSNEDIKLNIF
jgi:hypothetical protein